MERFKGFSLAELLVVIGIIAILATVAVMKYDEWREAYLFSEEATKLEYAIRRAKIMAMERSSYIRVSASGNELTIEDCGFNNTSCSVVLGYTFNFNLSSTGDVIFSPRGLAHSFGSFCLSDSGRAFRVVVNRGGIRVERGTVC